MQVPQRASLLKQVLEILRQNLRDGLWPEFMPSERILADELQVSRPTVRAALKVLHREGVIRISQGKQTRVVKRHRANAADPKIVTLLTPLPLHSITGSILLVINELRRHLQDAGYRLKLQSDMRLNDRNSRASLEKQVLQSVNSVWILLHQRLAVQQFFADRGLLTIAFGSTYKNVDIPSFDVDFRAVCRHAAGLLLRRGHRSIGFVTPKIELAGDLASEEGFRAAFEVSQHSNAHPLIISHKRTVQSLCAAVDQAIHAR